MSIPQRLYRIAKHKLTELKEHIETLDEENQAEKPRPAPDQSRPDARRELNDALGAPLPASAPSAAPANPYRTPEDSVRSTSAAGASSGTLAKQPQAQTPESDPLLYHYRLLGLEPGSDFVTIQERYHTWAARADPNKFPVGSEDARTAENLRKKLEESYRVLRDALDPMSRRFSQLEL